MSRSGLLITTGLFSLLATMAWGTPSSARTLGPSGSGGGDRCEGRIKAIIQDLRVWVDADGGSQLDFKNLRSAVDAVKYKEQMSAVLNDSLRVVCVGPGEEHYPVEYGGQAKECRSGFLGGVRTIICDRAKVYTSLRQPENDPSQYRIVHHELATLAEIETPHAGDSEYVLSHQITSQLEDQVVKRLVIRPQRVPDKYVAGTIVADYEGYARSDDNYVGAIFYVKLITKTDGPYYQIQICDSVPIIWNSHYVSMDARIKNRIEIERVCHSPLEISVAASSLRREIEASRPRGDVSKLELFEKLLIEKAGSADATYFGSEFKNRLVDPKVFPEALESHSWSRILLLLEDYRRLAVEAVNAGENVGYLKTLRDYNSRFLVKSGGLHWRVWATRPVGLGRGDANNGFVKTPSPLGLYVSANEEISRYAKTLNDNIESVAMPRLKGCHNAFGPGWRLPTLSEVQNAAPDLARSSISKIVGDHWIATQTATKESADGQRFLAMNAVMLTPNGWSKSIAEPVQNLRTFPLAGDERRYTLFRDFLQVHIAAKTLAAVCVRDARFSGPDETPAAAAPNSGAEIEKAKKEKTETTVPANYSGRRFMCAIPRNDPAPKYDFCDEISRSRRLSQAEIRATLEKLKNLKGDYFKLRTEVEHALANHDGRIAGIGPIEPRATSLVNVGMKGRDADAELLAQLEYLIERNWGTVEDQAIIRHRFVTLQRRQGKVFALMNEIIARASAVK